MSTIRHFIFFSFFFFFFLLLSSSSLRKRDPHYSSESQWTLSSSRYLFVPLPPFLPPPSPSFPPHFLLSFSLSPIGNILLLQKKIFIHPDHSVVSLDQLMGLVGDYLMTSQPQGTQHTHNTHITYKHP